MIKNIIYGSSLIVTSIIVFSITAGFPAFRIRGQELPGPKFFPNILSMVILAAGIYVIVLAIVKEIIRRRKAEPPQKTPLEDTVTKRGFLNILAVTVGTFLYIIMVDITGFNLTTVAFSSLLMMMLNVRWWRALIYSVILVVVIVLIFGTAFRIPLPEGSLFWTS